jgi:glutamate-1-semialdehyde 2,1-aminomutase
MSETPLYHVWKYTDIDRAFWAEHLEGWVPARVLDAHTHIAHTGLRLFPMTEAMRRQYWVNEVFEPIDAPAAARCYGIVFPNREVRCLAFGIPFLDFDVDAGNTYVQQECLARGWLSLAVIRPQWSQEEVAAELARPGVVGVKPYYALISHNRETRDAHLEASIFDFLPHHVLEVVNERRAWVTLHVPKAARLGHPDNLREIKEIRRRYPRVALVLAHLGRCYTEPHALAGIPPLADDPGIYFDTSAVLNPACHRVALQHAGPERVIYGTDNPILFMRGRREYRGTAYINRTSYPFHFNQDREPPEVEARYTLYMYEDLRALKQACQELGIQTRGAIEDIFYNNAARLLNLAESPATPARDGQSDRHSPS